MKLPTNLPEKTKNNFRFFSSILFSDKIVAYGVFKNKK